jgi:hypothetical protein
VCSQRSTAKTSIARQGLVRHVSAATDVHQNNRGTAGDGDLCSVRPEDVMGGHEVDSALIQS